MANDMPRPPEYWEGVKTDYLGGLKLPDLYARHGCTKDEFNAHRRAAGWPMRHKIPVSREKLTTRILWLMNQHVAALEANLKPGDHDDVAALNQLVGTLGRLIRAQSASGKDDGKRSRNRDLHDIREKLVRRIEELKRD